MADALKAGLLQGRLNQLPSQKDTPAATAAYPALQGRSPAASLNKLLPISQALHLEGAEAPASGTAALQAMLRK